MNYDFLYDLNSKCVLQKKDSTPLIEYFKKKQGWIYIAKSKDNPYLKIGRTAKDPLTRAKTLSSTGVLNEYEIIFSLKFFNQYWGEKNIHKILNKFRVNKEFFSINQDVAFEVSYQTKTLEDQLLGRFLDINIILDDLELMSYSLK